MEAAVEPGTVLGGRYRIVAPLARGGMGSVWRAEHLALNFELAVKIVDPKIASQERGLERFLREARALAALCSPYIVTVMDFGSHGELAYLVMELLEGRTLGQRLKAEGKLSAAETQRILRHVCKAMSHAHERGIVHRDLKPENIFLCDRSREHVTKVLDFGIAKPTGGVVASVLETGAGAFLGTPSYMSPEQCRGLTPIDQRSDLWALGAIAYECLQGERLFSGASVGDLAVRICSEDLPLGANDAQLPPGFHAWLEKAMARDPAQRFQSANELFAGLEPVLDAAAANAARGVDSAETLSERLAPAYAPGLVSSSNSTFARASLTKSVAPARGRTRASVAIVAGSGVTLALAAATLIRGGGAPSPRHSAAESPLVQPTAMAPGAPPAGEEQRPPDAGAIAPALDPLPALQEPPKARVPSSRTLPPKRDPLPETIVPETDLLRRQR